MPLQSSGSGITTNPAFTAIREGDDAAWDSRQKVERGAEGPWNGEAGIALHGLPRALFHVGDREPAEGRQPWDRPQPGHDPVDHRPALKCLGDDRIDEGSVRGGEDDEVPAPPRRSREQRGGIQSTCDPLFGRHF